MKINRILQKVVVAAVVASGSAGATSSQEAPGVTNESVTVGTWLTLSGPVAVYGVPLRAGADAYLNALNEAGGVNGRKINWIVEDSAYNPQQTIAIARKLISRDNVFAILLPHGTAQSAAALPFVEENKIPFLLPYGQKIEWYEPDPLPGVLGLHVLYENQVETLGRWAAKEGHKKIAVAYGANAAFEAFAKRVPPSVTSANEAATTELIPVKTGTTDFAPIALDLTRRGFDAIVSIQTNQDVSLLAKSLRQQGSDVQLYIWAPGVANSTIELGGSFVEGLKSVSLTSSPLADTPAAKEYREALAKYFPGQKPDFVSYLGYGAAKVFAAALAKSKEPLTRTSLLEGFYALDNYDSGVFPPVSYSADKPLGSHLLFPMVVKDGAWVSAGDLIDVRASK